MHTECGHRRSRARVALPSQVQRRARRHEKVGPAIHRDAEVRCSSWHADRRHHIGRLRLDQRALRCAGLTAPGHSSWVSCAAVAGAHAMRRFYTVASLSGASDWCCVLRRRVAPRGTRSSVASFCQCYTFQYPTSPRLYEGPDGIDSSMTNTMQA